MDDPVSEICDKLGVDRGEALFYLEGFNWDLDSAMEACRDKTLPIPVLTNKDSSPETPINVNSTPENLTTPPRMTDSVRISNPPENQQQLSSQARTELLRQFVDTIPGTTPHDAIEYLTRSKWNIHVAIGEFFDGRSPATSEMEDFLSTVPLDGSSSSSSLMKFDPTEPMNEADEALKAASQANVERINSVPMVIDSSGSSSQLLRSRELQSSQLNDTLIDSFLGFVGGATREEAITCLKLCDWDVGLAVNYFYEEETAKAMEMNWQENRGNQGLPSQSQFEASLGYPNQEGTSRSSSSSLNADTTEIGRPFDETGLVDIPVAASGIATSQAVKNWNPVAVDEDPSTETGPDRLATQDTNIVEPRAEAITTDITLQVFLAEGKEGTEVEMTFRPDQTVRDIHNRLAELRADDNKDYYLMSEADIYDDLNTTVQVMYSRGATKLLQVER